MMVLVSDAKTLPAATHNQSEQSCSTFSVKSKDSQFTLIYDKEKDQIIKFVKIDPGNI